MTQALNNAYENLQGIGRVWATYGVNLSKTALDTGAERLKATASYLEALSARMDELGAQFNPADTAQDSPAEEQAAEA